MIILAACKIQSQKPGEVELVKEDFELDLKNGFETDDVVDFGANVYSFKGAKDSKFRLKLSCFDKGGGDEIFDIDLADLEDGEKLGFELSSNEVNVYEISDKKISQVTKFDYEDQIFTNGEFKVWEWTEGGLLKGDESYPVFAAFLTESNEFSFIGLENPDFRSQFKNNKDISALVLEISISDEK